jgi:DNA-binding NtrC family response regulator
MTLNKTVLIVDDEEPIRKLLRARFEREGLTVLTACDAGEALELLMHTPAIAVLVTDVKMPGKDGLALTAEAKEIVPDLKVIVMTGHGEKSTAISALRLGACDYLEKPFDMEEMTHSVNRALKESRLENHAGSVTGSDADSHADWNSPEKTSSYTVLKKKWSESFEKEYLTKVLIRHQGNVTAAAKEACVDRSNFLRLLRRHQIDAAHYRITKKAA